MKCQTNGHHWRATTSDAVQQCETCQKKRQKINGQWFLITAQKSQVKPQQAMPGQLQLWEEKPA